MSLTRIRNNLVSIGMQVENAINEIDEMLGKKEEPEVTRVERPIHHEGPTEVKSGGCEHPTGARIPATTMGSGPDAFFCNICDKKVEV